MHKKRVQVLAHGVKNFGMQVFRFVCLFFFLSSFPIKMLATDAKMQTIEPDPFLFFLYDGQMFLR